MTKRKSGPMTASELNRALMRDPEFLAQQEVRNREITERSARLRIEEEPILADLRAVGRKVESVWDLVNTATRYAEAIPILLRHLLLPYSDRTREGIARALAVPEPEVRRAWPILVEEYRKAPIGSGVIAPGEAKEYRLSTKSGLACALAVAVTDETLPELIALAKDRAQGSSRLLLLSALRKSKNPLAKQAIEDLADDPDLTKEIASWRKRKRR
jgi:hypothetical protein